MLLVSELSYLAMILVFVNMQFVSLSYQSKVQFPIFAPVSPHRHSNHAVNLPRISSH